MPSTLEIGKRLVDLCKQRKNMDAIETLYAPEVVSVEPRGGPDFPARIEGIDGVRRKNDWWHQNHEVHKADVAGPWANGDKFVVEFKYDVTGKGGPMAGKRMTMQEAALYTVRDGKIV